MPKRKRTDRRDERLELFQDGSIVRIVLKNFMTYRKVELKAGPYLNMILGPNGTGKSAIVCGIILGLGGEASTTGRASHLQEYVKFGCKSATIFIEIYNSEGENYTIERKILVGDKKNPHSEWKLNGSASSHAEVKGFIAGLNIRVDNLCQFLPQERVVEFVKMNSKQLLENTEKAAGDVAMFQQHMKLVALSKEIKELETKRNEVAKQLETETTLNDRLAEEVKRVKEKEDYEKKIDLLQKKKPWVEFEEARIEYKNASEELNKKENELKRCRKKHAPLQQKVDEMKNKFKNCQENCVKVQKEFKNSEKQLHSLKNKLTKLNDETTSKFNDFETKKQQEEKRKQTIRDAENEIKVLTMKMESLRIDKNLDSQIEEVQTKMNELMQEIEKLKEEKFLKREEKDSLELKHRKAQASLRSIEDVYSKRLELLRRNNQNAYDAVIWLEANKDKFAARVFPPIMTQINVKDGRFAKYFEKLIPTRDLMAFTFEETEDLKKFNELLWNEKRIRVPVVMKPPQELESFVPRITLNQLRNYGFTNYLIDLFTAPKIIKAYICSQFNLHDIPIGSNVDAPRVINRLNLRRFIANDCLYLTTVSRYDQEKVVSSDKITDKQLLNEILNEEKLREEKETIKRCRDRMDKLVTEIQEIEHKIEEIDKDWSNLRQKKKDLILKKDEKNIISMNIQRKKDLIRKFENQAVDLNQVKIRVTNDIKSLYEEKLKTIELMSNHTKLGVELFIKKISLTFQFQRASFLKKKAEEDLEKADSAFKTLEDEIRILRNKKDSLKREEQQKKTIAFQAIGIGVNANEIPLDLKREFRKLPDNLEEINSEIRNYTLRINSISTNSGQNVIRDYNKRAQLIRRKQDEVNRFQVDIQVKKTELTALKCVWLPKLESLIEKINHNFGRFMERLEYAGEVVLSHGQDAEDFEKYGIAIKVRYRDNESLKELSAFHQSGGERSVATMIYMIALQELTKVPFRCVDEINQGMDNKNERKVFDLIVETASKNSSQYFLFSPKLLSGLSYTEKMHIHIVLNGPNLQAENVSFNRRS
ncbi:structural maintenance of chromosomes protein 5-like protein [Dinothrombium tinctorium]|uniref:Structural maintenance of chromosomes protein 5 n=1 Tax=Dinothrombium tinctorium TaxID=1965070 RepID=A0A443RN68_9ACAR|nr:structural maintenance of chromosomes protein 5-like protein [Dinothrombium tinctorium]